MRMRRKGAGSSHTVLLLTCQNENKFGPDVFEQVGLVVGTSMHSLRDKLCFIAIDTGTTSI